MGRKVKTWEQITNGGQTADTRTLISQMDYNETGQLWKKHLHSTDSVNFRQDITYAYNERGWLKTNSSPLFAEELRYNTGATKYYNGNIAYQFARNLRFSDLTLATEIVKEYSALGVICSIQI